MTPEEYADLLFEEIEYRVLVSPASFVEWATSNTASSSRAVTVEDVLAALPEAAANRWRLKKWKGT